VGCDFADTASQREQEVIDLDLVAPCPDRFRRQHDQLPAAALPVPSRNCRAAVVRLGRPNAVCKPLDIGLIQAAGEYLDHGRTYRSRDSYLGRTLIRPERLKVRAIKLAEAAADGSL
jgi:hypothetical protein